ncbi:MAG: hypothetical protein P1U58_07880, partial [Verrucomicrobiales bacterium]|nr:hypothetical protein [Verrucomicrobiales bacterium]
MKLPPALCLPSLLLAAALTTGVAVTMGGEHPATESLGTLTRPLADTLDFPTFNPAEGEKTDKNLGEILSLFDDFLAAQGITPEGTKADLEKLYVLISRDFALASGKEDYYDDLYDDLDDEADDLADDLEDWEEDQREAKEKKD